VSCESQVAKGPVVTGPGSLGDQGGLQPPEPVGAEHGSD
jgi:hypothetical protein